MREQAIKDDLPEELENLYLDALKRGHEYWNLDTVKCSTCIAKKAYGVNDCNMSKLYDVIVRAYLLGKEQK